MSQVRLRGSQQIHLDRRLNNVADFRKRKLYKRFSTFLLVNSARFGLHEHARTCTRHSRRTQE